MGAFVYYSSWIKPLEDFIPILLIGFGLLYLALLKTPIFLIGPVEKL
jgi:hypothetical protein